MPADAEDIKMKWVRESSGLRGKHIMKKIWLSLLLLSIACSTNVCTQRADSTKEEANLFPTDLDRVHVGIQAPDFTLVSSDNEQVTLSSYRGKKNVVLVFYRGYW